VHVNVGLLGYSGSQMSPLPQEFDQQALSKKKRKIN